MAAHLSSIVSRQSDGHFDRKANAGIPQRCRVGAISNPLNFNAPRTSTQDRVPSIVSLSSHSSTKLEFLALNDENRKPSFPISTRTPPCDLKSLSESEHSDPREAYTPPSLDTAPRGANAARLLLQTTNIKIQPERVKSTDYKSPLNCAPNNVQKCSLNKTIETKHVMDEETSVSPRSHDNGRNGETLIATQFGKWADSFRRRQHEHRYAGSRMSKESFGGTNNAILARNARTFPLRRVRLRKSTSRSSSGLVATLKTASLSAGSLSVLQRSTRNSYLSEHRGNRSSRLSTSNLRFSTDSDRPQTSALDEAARNRGLKRRQIIDELLSSEEGYVADLKVLTYLFSTVLPPRLSTIDTLRSSIHHNVMTILHLHEALLRDLLRLAERYTPRDYCLDKKQIPTVRRHTRWHSLGSQLLAIEKTSPTPVRSSFEHHRYASPLSSPAKNGIAECSEAAEISCLVRQYATRFFVYEEYCSKYELMVNDISNTQRSDAAWSTLESGIEALAKSVIALDSVAGEERKGLMVGDLLIKPIQRICRYPLLFADLHKHTPVIDCPLAHTEVDATLCYLREHLELANKATDDRSAREKVQRTWLLRGRLRFVHEQTSWLEHFGDLGQANLCGVLYVSYQTRSKAKGEYMVCVLFKAHLLLAVPSILNGKYDVLGIIPLVDSKIESTEDGRGLQCHTALFSWKLMFASKGDICELLFSACSQTEEDTWRQHMQALSSQTTHVSPDHIEPPIGDLAMLRLELKTLGRVFGHPGSLTRRLSIQRAATVGTRSNVCQVIIRNTHNPQDDNDHRTPDINRSYSLLTKHRIAVLAPRRTERVRLEQSVVDIWSRDVLPYPGMTVACGAPLLRASAGSLVRKLSRASMHGPFSRRSASINTIPPIDSHDARTSPTDEEMRLPSHDKSPQQSPKEGLEPVPRTSSRCSTRQETPNSSRKMSMSGMRMLVSHGAIKKTLVSKVASEANEEKDIVERKPLGRKRWGNPLGVLKNISTESVRHLLYSSKTA